MGLGSEGRPNDCRVTGGVPPALAGRSYHLVTRHANLTTAFWFSLRGTFVLTGVIFLAAAAVTAMTVCRPTLPPGLGRAARLGRDQHLPED